MADTNILPTFDSDGDNSAQSLRAHPGKLYKVNAYNPNSVDAWIQFFDLATGDVTVGTTTPYFALFVPAQGANADDTPHDGIFFPTAMSYACTTTPTGNTDPATGLTISFFAK